MNGTQRNEEGGRKGWGGGGGGGGGGGVSVLQSKLCPVPLTCHLTSTT